MGGAVAADLRSGPTVLSPLWRGDAHRGVRHPTRGDRPDPRAPAPPGVPAPPAPRAPTAPPGVPPDHAGLKPRGVPALDAPRGFVGCAPPSWPIAQSGVPPRRAHLLAGYGRSGLRLASRTASGQPRWPGRTLGGSIVKGMLEARASGYMLKDDDRQELIDGIRVVAAGLRYLSRRLRELDR